jgi:serine/threonine protein kinase
MNIEEVPPGGPPWKSEHEGVPASWTGKGAGGNAHVWWDGKHAIKRLRPNTSKEPVARFTREAMLLSSLAGEGDLAVVPVIAVRRRAGEVEIVMEAFDGNLDEVIGEFSGQPEKAASALLSIVSTLARLASRPHPIHHRDIKPENLLYRRRSDEIDLALGDFGCAYLAEDERLTPTHRAIGAWAYRCPEYSIGRVANVDEKGDVFSLGKVLWAMVNGQRHVVFPGPVWFLEEFDLARKFPETPKIHHAMVVIAQACDIRAERRPTLAQFAVNLRDLVAASTGAFSMNDDELNEAMLRAEALREIAYQQRRAFATRFVCALHDDFLQSLEILHNAFPRSALFKEWREETERRSQLQTQQTLVAQVADHESDVPVSNVFFRKILLFTRFYPANGTTPIRFVARVEDQTGQVPPSELTVLGTSEGIKASHRYSNGPSGSEPYRASALSNFLKEAARRLPA